MQPETLDPQIVNLAKAIRQTESQGNFQAKGASGEYGAYQFLPTTWNAASTKYLGSAVPLDKATPEQQNEVAYKQLADWKTEHPDWNIGNFASAWNAGPNAPDAYKNNNVGTNAQGVKYDTPTYAKKVADAYHQLKSQTGGYAPPSAAGAAPAQGGANSYAPPPPPPAPITTTNQNTPASASGSGFLQNEGNSVTNRLGQAGNALAQTATGQINPLSGLLQVGGAIGGGVSDLAGNVLGAITPDFIKKPLEGAAQGVVNAAANTSLGKAAIGGVQNFSQAHPELAADIGAVGNIAGGLGVVTGAGALKDAVGGVIGRTLGKDALSSTIADISPEIKAGTKAGGNYAKGTGNSKNMFGNINRNVDPHMREVAGTVKEVIPDFDKLPTFTDKLNAVKNGVVKLAQQLRTNLGGEIQPLLQPEDIATLRQQIAEEMAKNPYVAKGSDEAEKILNEFVRRLPQTGDITMEDVLNARQGLDQWMKSLRGEGVFDPAKENAISIGLRAVRQGANNLMEAKVPNAGVKALLKKQSQLYDAIDGMAIKADKEVGSGLVSRFAKRHPHITRGLKYTGTAIGTGLGIREGQNLLGE